MSTSYQIVEQNELHFVTFQIIHWIDIFTRQLYRDIVIDNLRFCQQNKGLEIYAFVIMSNHIHLILRSPDNKLSNIIRDFKSFTSKKIITAIHEITESRKKWLINLFELKTKKHQRNDQFQVWTHDNHAEILYQNQFIDQKVRYIHNNPVRAGIVIHPEDYLYSSARSYAGFEGVLEIIPIINSIEKKPFMRTLR